MAQYLKDHSIEFEERPLEASPTEGTRNVLLKDKKNRLVLISFLPTTQIDMKVLALRLGIGKGGLKDVTKDSESLLKVAPNCLSPLAVSQDVLKENCMVLLLDAKFQSQRGLLFQQGQIFIVVSPDSLVQYVRSIGASSAYADLEVPFTPGKDSRPDLVSYMPEPANEDAANGHDLRSSVPKSKDKQQHSKGNSQRSTSVEHLALEIMDKVGSLATSKEEVEAELKHLLVMFKNQAYVDGYSAARRQILFLN